MNVLQLIDSLNPGGAERMAVNYSNASIDNINTSFLCVTRHEGILKDQVSAKVTYIYLQKRAALDISALRRLRRFVKANKITLVHAHSTSFFFATLLKLTMPKLKLIWHEHHGKRVTTTQRNNVILYLCSFHFNKIITVNEDLQTWCQKNLATKKVFYVPNFVSNSSFFEENNEREKTIVCLANLRVPKNHLNLLEAFSRVNSRFPNWKLQFIGKDFEDSYSEILKKYVAENNLQSVVSFIGSSYQADMYLRRAAIGVLASDSEGLPMALLEYGASKLAVVATDVGFCKNVVGINGKIVAPQNSEALADAICLYIGNDLIRERDALHFYQHIRQHYSLDAIMSRLKLIYN